MAVVDVAVAGAAIRSLAAGAARRLASAGVTKHPEGTLIPEGLAGLPFLAVLVRAAEGRAAGAVAGEAPLAVGPLAVAAELAELLLVGRIEALGALVGEIAGPALDAFASSSSAWTKKSTAWSGYPKR